jgi:hypothetical protein
MSPYDIQLANERQFNRKHIDKYIRMTLLENPATVAKIQDGVRRVHEWLSQSYYASKQSRLDQLKGLDIDALVMDIMVGVAYCQQETLFTSVSSQLAGRIGFSDKADSIKTVAELLAVLCFTDAFDICKASKSASLVVINRMPLSERLINYIENSRYLPPMMCEPMELTHNHSSGYLTHNDSLILGRGNHHDGDLCLDVLNTQNRVALKLSIEFLCTVEEEPSEITEDKIIEKAAKQGKYLSYPEASQRKQVALENWSEFRRQSYQLYHLIVTQGNKFHLTHKPDKRGRIYAQGYHITTQGSSFKKASIELAHEEIVTGVPGR